MASDSSSTARTGTPPPSASSNNFRSSSQQSLPQSLPQSASLILPHTTIEALQISLNTGRFSDLTIIHGNRRWKAHKVVVCNQSSVLDSMIEALQPNSTLHLTAYDYEAVCLMMEYFYTSDYVTIDRDPDFSLSTHTKVFSLAIRFAIPSLEELAATKYHSSLNNNVTNLETYFSSVKDIYAVTTSTNPGLRNAVVEAAIMEMQNLLAEPVRARFIQITSEVPDFQADIFLVLLRNPVLPVEVVVQELCVECGPTSEDDRYEVTKVCKGCGKECTIGFN